MTPSAIRTSSTRRRAGARRTRRHPAERSTQLRDIRPGQMAGRTPDGTVWWSRPIAVIPFDRRRGLVEVPGAGLR